MLHMSWLEFSLSWLTLRPIVNEMQFERICNGLLPRRRTIRSKSSRWFSWNRWQARWKTPLNSRVNATHVMTKYITTTIKGGHFLKGGKQQMKQITRNASSLVETEESFSWCENCSCRDAWQLRRYIGSGNETIKTCMDAGCVLLRRGYDGTFIVQHKIGWLQIATVCQYHVNNWCSRSKSQVR